MYITGTTRVGKSPETSVADANFRVCGSGSLRLVGEVPFLNAAVSNPMCTSEWPKHHGIVGHSNVLKSVVNGDVTKVAGDVIYA